MCTFPLREEEKALWAFVMRSVSPLRAGLRVSVSCSVSSSEGERKKGSSLVKGALTTPHSHLNTQIKDRSTVAYNEHFQQGKSACGLSCEESYKSVHETRCDVMRQSVCQVYKGEELQVSRGTRPHPTVHLLRSVRAVSKEQKRAKGCRYSLEEYSYRDLSKQKNKSRFSAQWSGQWHDRVESRLDLHGLSVQEAFNQFMVFIEAAQQRGNRCIEIITGLGSGEEGGILRRELPHWLERADVCHNILEVVYAYNSYKRHRKGEYRKVLNRGAIRILLRQKK